MNHRERHLGARFALELLHRFVDGDVGSALPVDLDNRIAGHQAGAIGRRPYQGAPHDQFSPLEHDLDPDAAELALHGRAEAVHFLRADVGGVGIELAEDPLDRRLDQLPPAHFPHVVPLDLVDRVDKDLLQFVVVLLVFGGLILGRLGGLCQRGTSQTRARPPSPRKQNRQPLPATPMSHRPLSSKRLRKSAHSIINKV